MDDRRRSSVTGRDVAAAWITCVLIGSVSLAVLSAFNPGMPPAATIGVTNATCVSPHLSACRPPAEQRHSLGAVAIFQPEPTPHFVNLGHG